MRYRNKKQQAAVMARMRSSGRYKLDLDSIDVDAAVKRQKEYDAKKTRVKTGGTVYQKKGDEFKDDIVYELQPTNEGVSRLVPIEAGKRTNGKYYNRVPGRVGRWMAAERLLVGQPLKGDLKTPDNWLQLPKGDKRIPERYQDLSKSERINKIEKEYNKLTNSYVDTIPMGGDAWKEAWKKAKEDVETAHVVDTVLKGSFEAGHSPYVDLETGDYTNKKVWDQIRMTHGSKLLMPIEKPSSTLKTPEIAVERVTKSGRKDLDEKFDALHEALNAATKPSEKRALKDKARKLIRGAVATSGRGSARVVNNMYYRLDEFGLGEEGDLRQKLIEQQAEEARKNVEDFKQSSGYGAKAKKMRKQFLVDRVKKKRTGELVVDKFEFSKMPKDYNIGTKPLNPEERLQLNSWRTR